jgi:hypothetical protein
VYGTLVNTPPTNAKAFRIILEDPGAPNIDALALYQFWESRNIVHYRELQIVGLGDPHREPLRSHSPRLHSGQRFTKLRDYYCSGLWTANDPPMAANRAPSSRLPKAANDVLEAAAALASAAFLAVCTVWSRVCFSFASASSNRLTASSWLICHLGGHDVDDALLGRWCLGAAFNVGREVGRNLLLGVLRAHLRRIGIARLEVGLRLLLQYFRRNSGRLCDRLGGLFDATTRRRGDAAERRETTANKIPPIAVVSR